VIPLLATIAPPYDWDEVAYGASLPLDYAQAGRFFYNADYGPYSAFPANFEALTTASLVLGDSVVLARLLNVALALGLALVAVRLSACLGVPRVVAPLAAALVLAAPSVQAGALMVKNDLAAAFMESLTLLALAGYSLRRRRGWLALAGVFLGAAVGTKYSSLQFALCVVPVAAVLMLRGARTPAALIRAAAVFGVAATALALPWYGRNLLQFGNPFYPFLNEALGAANHFTAQHSTLTWEMFHGLTGFSRHSAPPRTLLDNTAAGFAWAPVVLGLPGLVLAVTTRRSTASLLLAAVLVPAGLLIYLVGFWSPRYFMSLLTVASALSTLTLAELGRAVRLLPGRGRAAAIAVAVLFVLIGGHSLRRQWQAHGGLLEALYRGDKEEFIRGRVAYWDVADWLNHNTPAGDRVGMGLQLQPFYYLERPYFHIHPLTEKGNLQALEAPEEFLDAFHSLGLDWLAVNRWRPGRTYLRSRAPGVIAFRKRFEAAIDALARDGKLDLVARRGPVRLFRIAARPGAGDGGQPQLEGSAGRGRGGRGAPYLGWATGVAATWAVPSTCASMARP
jgi:hypothetical protein